MDRAEVRAMVIEVLKNQLNIDQEKISDEMTISEDLEADSLDGTEIIMEIEDKLEEKGLAIKIPDDDARSLKTVGSFVDYIVDRLPPGSPVPET